MSINQDMIDFHISNGYFIRAQRMKMANGCFIEYPKSILTKQPMEPVIYCYFIEDNQVRIMIQKENKDGEDVKITIPNYAARVIISEDILLKTISFRLNHELIFCFDKDGKVMDEINNLPEILNSPEIASDRIKEAHLMNLLKDTLLGLDSSQQAEELQINDGYKVMKKIFDNGGTYV